MVKDRTLRRKKCVPKKRYFHKGGQLEFKAILDSYQENIQSKRELYTSIQNEGTVLYDSVASTKNVSVSTTVNSVILFLEDFFQGAQTKNTDAQQNIQQTLVTYGIEYAHKFTFVTTQIKSVLSKINEQLDVARNINEMFQMKQVHLHLIDKYLKIVNSINVNPLNVEMNNLLSKINTIIADIKTNFPLKEKQKRDTIEAIEGKTQQLGSAIGMVNRAMPEGFIPSNVPFIQGCPLGTVLEGDQCVYYNDLSGAKTKIESVPLQKSLVNTITTDYITWFNKINEIAVGNPIFFKRKELQYIVPLSPDDAKLFNAKYIVSEQNGVPKEEYRFIEDIVCCWDQLSALLTESTTETVNSYYMDYDNIPQPVKLLDHVAPTIRKDESFTKYVRLLSDFDQILTGIQYVETDSTGNVLYAFTHNAPEAAPAPEVAVAVAPAPAHVMLSPIQSMFSNFSLPPSPLQSIIGGQMAPVPAPALALAPVPATAPVPVPATAPAPEAEVATAPAPEAEVATAPAPAPEQVNSVIPFYPKLYDYILNNTIFTKTAYNGIDTFQYILLPNVLDPLDSLKPLSVVLDTGVLNQFSYTLLTKFNANKYLEINIDKIYCPFVLPQVLMNEGDYYIIHNISVEFPIVISISKDDKRVVLYPNEICCFVYSQASTILQYGFLSFEKNPVYATKTKKVTKISTGDYVFVNTKALYDNGTFIMQTIEPILDSEKNLIAVPNFNETTLSYYEIDDIYEHTPVIVSIVLPQHVTLDNKTYDSAVVSTKLSKEYLPYSTEFVVISSIGNMFLFSDSNGIPRIDAFGYFIPVPSPLFYDGTSIFWYAIDKKKVVTLKGHYNYAGTFDSYANPLYTLRSPYAANYNKKIVYTDSNAIPIIGDENTFIEVLDLNGVTVLDTNITIANAKVSQIYSIDEQKEITTSMLKNKINIYLQTTDLLINKYKDISGNMNDLNILKGNLSEQYRAGTNINDAINIYNKVLDTHDKLATYMEANTNQQLDSINANQVKTTRNNELKQIKSILDSLEQSFSNTEKQIKPLNDINFNSDYATLYDTYLKAQKSYATINNNLTTINDIDTLKVQENNVNILLNSVQIIQTNLKSLQQSIDATNLAIVGSLLNKKKSILQGIIITIENEKSRVETYKEQHDSLKPNEELNLQFNTTYQQIQSIFNKIQTDISNNVMETVDTIDPKINLYKSYLTSIKLEETNLETILSSMTNAASVAVQTQLTTEKNKIYKKIQDFQKNNDAIETLLNTLPISKETYIVDLTERLLEINTIKTTVDTSTDFISLQADEARVDELTQMNNETQTELQTIQLNVKATSNANATLKGGSSKKIGARTRKIRKLVIGK